MMPNNYRKPGASTSGQTKLVRKVQTRKFVYRVGYNWNKGGRLKELRIRHLARKFLHIWMHNTFGRVLPHTAKSHYDSVVLRRAFEGWIDEWWTSRREWSLQTRAECHYRYYLYNWVFHSWRTFLSLRQEKKNKLKTAQSYADRQQMQLVWDRWEVFTDMRRMKKRMCESALEQNRLATLRFSWSLWQTRLQQHQHLHTLEEQCLKQRELTLQRTALHQWKETHAALCCHKDKETKASLHFILRLKRKTLHQWIGFVSCCQTKRKAQAAARHARDLRLVTMCWSNWSKALHRRLSEEDRLQASAQLATWSTERRALQRWGAYVTLCRDKAEVNHMANQHHLHHLLSAGMQGLHLNVTWNRTQRLNNSMALQQYHQSMMRKFWRLWQEHQEEAEDESFQPLRESATSNYRRRRCTWVLSTWWSRAEKHKEQILSERMAVLHEQRRLMQRALARWRQRTEQRVNEKEKVEASDCLYLQRLLHNTVTQWKDNSAEIRDSRDRECQARHQGDLCCMRRALDTWKKFVQMQRVKKGKLEEMQLYHESKLLRHTCELWKKHHLQMSGVYSRSEELYTLKLQHFLRTVLSVWRENAALQAENRLMEQRAQNHFQHLLQSKVLHSWQEATTRAASKRHQEAEAVSVVNRELLLQTFRRWRMKTKDARRERMSTERARRHHKSKLLWKTLRRWNKYHEHLRKYKVMRRQGMMLLRLKIYQSCFDQWKIKLQHRRRDVKQTEQALWHWSLTLQAKVLCGWRLWVSEQRRTQQLLRDAAHVDQLTSGLTQHRPEHSGRRLQGVVQRCALRWKQRALSKPAKKVVTFCPTTRGPEEEQVFRELPPTRRRQPRRCEELFDSSSVVTHTSTRFQTEVDPHQTITASLGTQSQHVLLPPSAFMNADSQDIPDVNTRAESDPVSALTSDLLRVQLDMKRFQQDRRQLRAWHKLRKVLHRWLQTSAEDDEQMEKDCVYQELKELDERITRLSTELTEQKPAMLRHAEKIQRLQNVLHTEGLPSLKR